MSTPEPIDHRATADALLRLAVSARMSGDLATASALLAEAQVYATLALSRPRPAEWEELITSAGNVADDNADLGRQLRDLRAAVREMLRRVTTASGDSLARLPVEYVDRLRELAG